MSMLPSKVHFVGFEVWINGGNFSIQNKGPSRVVFLSVSLVDLGLGPVLTMVTRTLPSFGMNKDNIIIMQISAQWGLELI
jgi:hypothetical protein